jgi:hypothetical protein
MAFDCRNIKAVVVIECDHNYEHNLTSDLKKTIINEYLHVIGGI